MLSQQDLAEEARLQALHALGLLDTPREDRFDRFTRLALAAFNVRIALVSLVDRERQWFKSHAGLDYRETPRPLAFCSHAIALDDMLVVPDTLADERFAAHPHVTGAPGIRFYAGQPLHSVDGQPLGTLCIIDTAPRMFGDTDRRMLGDLAQLVRDELNRDVLVAARTRERVSSLMRGLSLSAREAVDGATYRGFSRHDDDRILSLLAIRADDKSRTIDLEFSGGATLRLAVAAIKAYATDLGEAWPTAWQPDHNADDAS